MTAVQSVPATDCSAGRVPLAAASTVSFQRGGALAAASGSRIQERLLRASFPSPVIQKRANPWPSCCVGAPAGLHKRQRRCDATIRHVARNRYFITSRSRAVPVGQDSSGAGQFAGRNPCHVTLWGVCQLFDRILPPAYSRLRDGVRGSIRSSRLAALLKAARRRFCSKAVLVEGAIVRVLAKGGHPPSPRCWKTGRFRTSREQR